MPLAFPVSSGMKLVALRIFDRMKRWTLHWAHSPHVATALFFVAFIESSFFPIPPDILMLAILLVNADRWRFYAFITVAGSVLGAFLGYFIGWGLYASVGQYIVETYNLQQTMAFVGGQYSQHAFLTIFTAAFTPIPYKIITIAAGLFKVSLWQLFLGSVVGRGLRYFILGYVIKVFGKRINSLIVKYFNIVSAIIVAVLIVLYILIKFVF